MNENCILTVSTYQYLPKALVLAESYFEHNQNADLIILVPDLGKQLLNEIKLPDTPNTTFIGGDELGHPEMKNIQKYFSALELCCAAKSMLVRYALLDRGYKKALLLDPDEMCLGSFNEIWLLLNDEDMLITPHSFSPYPEDKEDPNDLELLTSGFINAGFWGVRNSPSALSCLEWVIQKIVRFGFLWPSKSLYSDQNWMSCLPWYFPDTTHVLMHPGVNIAYWNLHERELRKTDGHFSSNGKPALFVHFSGFNENKPQELTQHSKRKFSNENETLLKDLVKNYSNRLQTVRNKMPKVIPDIPCNDSPLADRLKIYRQCRGHDLQGLSKYNESSSLRKLAQSLKRKLIRAFG